VGFAGGTLGKTAFLVKGPGGVESGEDMSGTICG
jgi:hypothetical protein